VEFSGCETICVISKQNTRCKPR